MEPIKTGKFIAQLRKERGFTQEQLGELLGVTNKTVSRWETGTYLPPVEGLCELGKVFSVTLNELLAGERVPEAAYRESAEETIGALLRVSPFGWREKAAYFKRKWLREHVEHHAFDGTGE